MLGINWSDVMNVIMSVLPQLIVIGVVLVLAIIVTVAVNKKTVADTATRKLIHSESWLVFLVVAVVSVSMMLFGPLATLLNSATATKYTLSEETISNASDLAKEIQSEAVTLLQNTDDNLPLADTNVNVFGWASTNPVYGGTGSGSMNANYETTSILQGMAEAGLTTNEELSKLYTDYRADRPVVAMADQDWTLPEVPAADYSQELIDSAKEFSDEAVIVIGRVGGEGADLPKNMKGEGITYTNNSTEYEDFEDGESFLELSKTEEDMIDLVTSNFDKVTLIYNGANIFELGFVENYPQIKSVLWCPPAGQTGFSALGDILAGTTNPSGKTSDTFVYDLTQQPSYNNAGDFKYENMTEFPTENFEEGETSPAFVNYVESIYVGYKFYETADDEGAIDYEATVQYPFGYGLSYTTFEQEMGDVTYADGTVSFDVTVTNTGDTAGKDVVEVYYNPPYTNGGIEKASANLVAFEKTELLEPGASETVSISFDDDDMASYDDQDAKAWVLEAGDYQVSINADSHTVLDEKTVTVDEDIVYNTEDNTHDGDAVPATNAFDADRGDVTYLSRADHFANREEALAAPTNYTLSDEYKAQFRNESNYDPAETNDDADEMPTTGAKGDVRLADLTGKEYDDPLWDELLDQLTFDEMDNLIAFGGFGTQAIDSIGKVALTDVDGPASLNNNFTGVGSIGFPSSTSVACTWNRDLARRFGEGIGDMAHDMDASGWYAPAMNIHRSAFGGRDFEYFSEDPLFSGAMASSEIAAAREQGVYAFMKHFVLNDQETNRNNMVCTWSNEQAIREIYMKPFEMSVKDGDTGAVMSSFNYIGPVYAGASSNLLNNVLRDEWGFRGMVLTDWYGDFGYQNGDQLVRAGNDAMLATFESSNHVTVRSASGVQALRTAAHNILYTAVNSWKYADGEPKAQTPVWQVATYVGIAVVAVIFLGLETLTIKRFLDRRNAVK
ncbi:glycoside hydrolase family 3 N-terminal domain-containing protein [Bifidobacterium pullorum]|uniref:Glycoside hydrolase family 3 C-terminal domain-containing protein n=1 Tax=Bifidobacterium pullorum subsp. gallinarum TaxID=78344 RepID=A0A921IYX7_9BIFI|nr:glycoside hydrolase family 3 N-terminal domain-containing protein [Bifidobacterium pullorum]HJG41697.1 glycoside hydrolase family 3 C-terminal domain-containing protein [Bifidobacterium pullorum subsp. gallinarum]